MRVEVIGVYPVESAEQPCHLVELRVADHHGPFDVGTVLQPRADENSALEQAPYLEHVLDESGTSGAQPSDDINVSEHARIAFFMHYLEENWRLRFAEGVVELPKPTPLPERLHFIEYYPP